MAFMALTQPMSGLAAMRETMMLLDVKWQLTVAQLVQVNFSLITNHHNNLCFVITSYLLVLYSYIHKEYMYDVKIAFKL